MSENVFSRALTPACEAVNWSVGDYFWIQHKEKREELIYVCKQDIQPPMSVHHSLEKLGNITPLCDIRLYVGAPIHAFFGCGQICDDNFCTLHGQYFTGWAVFVSFQLLNNSRTPWMQRAAPLLGQCLKSHLKGTFSERCDI